MTPATQSVVELDDRRLQSKQEGQAGPGRIDLGGLVIHYPDLRSLYMEYKDIFRQRIYHFDTDSPRPRIIDGGGCIGISVLYFKRAYPNARIMCFEPDGQLLTYLRRNLAENGAGDVELIESGLAARPGTARFVPDGLDGGRIVEDTEAGTTIKTVCLSEYLREPVDFLKLNIEGQELPVLLEAESAGRLGNVRELVLEYHGWSGGRQSLGAILDLLARNGFRYLVHDFDRETNPASKPPFRLHGRTPWFCLVYAKQCDRGVNEVRGPRPGVTWGGLRSVTPVSGVFGLDRGTCIDRYYIEAFLREHRADIQGRVLEVGDARYTRAFGSDRVTRSDVLHVEDGQPGATIVGDLVAGNGIPGDTFDCVILTQTLPFIYDVRSAVSNAFGALRPGGVILATVPGISQISRYDMERWGDYWRFTDLSARRLFEEVFGSGCVEVWVHGNVLAATAFLQGMTVEDLTTEELDYRDPDYPALITVRAVKRGAAT